MEKNELALNPLICQPQKYLLVGECSNQKENIKMFLTANI